MTYNKSTPSLSTPGLYQHDILKCKSCRLSVKLYRHCNKMILHFSLSALYTDLTSSGSVSSYLPCINEAHITRVIKEKAPMSLVELKCLLEKYHLIKNNYALNYLWFQGRNDDIFPCCWYLLPLWCPSAAIFSIITFYPKSILLWRARFFFKLWLII